MQAKDKLKILGKTPVGSTQPNNSNRLKTGNKALFIPYAKTDSHSVNLHKMSAADFVGFKEYFNNQMVVEENKPSVSFDEQPKSNVVIPYKPVGQAIAPPNAAAAKKYTMNAAELHASVAASDPCSVLKKKLGATMTK